MEEDLGAEGLTRRKRLTLGPWGRCPSEVTKANVGGPSSSTKARVTAEAQSGVPKRVNAEGHHLESDPGASVEEGTRADVGRRESCLKDPSMAERIAWATLLLRDRQFMSSLSIGDLMDQSMVNAIRVSAKFS